MRFPWRGLVLGALLFALGGCLIESDQLPGDPKAAPDPRLSGAWYQKSDSEMNIFVFGRARLDGTLVPVVDWLVVKMRAPQKIERLRYRYWTFKVGVFDVASVEALEPRLSGTPRRTFVAYRFDGPDRLRIALPHDRPVREAVEKGELAGRVERNQVRLTADAKTIAAFLARRGGEVFRFKDAEPLRPLPSTEGRR